jgi:hypothetical protein
MRKKLFVLILILISFLLGLIVSQRIPRTTFTHPLLTWRVMNSFPIGADVLPINTPQAKEQFERLGWWREPAVVVGYEAVSLQNKVIMLCQIRTRQGTGYIVSVNPSWLRPASLEESIAFQHVR